MSLGTSPGTPPERTLAMLRFLRKAAELLEKEINEDGTAPPWVLDKINQAAISMGVAVNYAKRARAARKGEA